MAEDVPTVLVTGSSGFIAIHIVKQLLQSGQYKVRGTVRSLQNEEKVSPVKNVCPDPTYPLELVEAELCDEKSWIDAVKGCSYVIHTASPNPLEDPKDENEVIKPAVDGTLNIMKACREAGSVRRVVLTSSYTAMFGDFTYDGKVNDDLWPDLSKPIRPYVKSKILAEKAAWHFIKELPAKENFELAVLHPVMVYGPVLNGGTVTGSQEPARRILERTMPMIPKLYFYTIDVRDVARAHINALTLPEASGKRHLLYTGGGWFRELGQILDEEFRQHGYNAVTMEAPNFLIKLNALFDPTIRMIVPCLGVKAEIESDRTSKLLDTEPIDLKTTFIDMAYSMIEVGNIKRSKGYKGPPSKAE